MRIRLTHDLCGRLRQAFGILRQWRLAQEDALDLRGCWTMHIDALRHRKLPSDRPPPQSLEAWLIVLDQLLILALSEVESYAFFCTGFRIL